MKNYLRKEQKQKGITLVALVITVVVMLILAGVAIAAITDGEGIFNKTQNASERYEQAVQNEAEQMQSLMDQIDDYLSGLPVDNNPVVKDEAVLGTVVTENQTFDGRLNGTYSNPIIPKGFAPVETAQDSTITSDAKWGEENGWKNGLVIQDANENQFVWVPVDGTKVKIERFDWEKGDFTFSSGTESIPTNISTSVSNNGGFYIARYEAGNLDDTVVSKKGATVWNNIDWNNSITQAEGMYASTNTNYGATSTLIYGAQWDAALKFIQAYSGDENYVIDSTGKGNYSGTSGGDMSSATPATCGVLEAFRKNNIYDMAGNVWEWTMEQYSSYRVSRGGSFFSSGSDYPASFRNDEISTFSVTSFGFRVTLYIK